MILLSVGVWRILGPGDVELVECVGGDRFGIEQVKVRVVIQTLMMIYDLVFQELVLLLVQWIPVLLTEVTCHPKKGRIERNRQNEHSA